MSKFSDFIRNATPEEKEAVFSEVMQKAADRQNAQIVQVLPLPAQPTTTITTTAMRPRLVAEIRAALEQCPGEPKVTIRGDLRDWLEIIDALEGRP